MPYQASHLAARLLYRRLGIALEGMTEGVVGGEEEPGIPAGLDDGGAGAVGQRPGVVGPMDRVWRAGLAGQIRGAAGRNDQRLVLLARDLVDGKRDRRGRDIDYHVDLIYVIPLPYDVRAHIGLVLMIGGQNLDLHPLLGGVEILH